MYYPYKHQYDANLLPLMQKLTGDKLIESKNPSDRPCEKSGITRNSVMSVIGND